MHPVAEIHLRNDVDAIRADEIDQHADLHPVSAGERQPLERGAAAGVLARQRLHDPGQVGQSKLTSGRATSSVTRPPPYGLTPSSVTSGRS